MKGLEKFKKEIEAAVQKSCFKDAKRKEMIEAQANEIIKHIEDVCDEEYDNLLTQDQKSFERMWQFVSNKARECAVNNCAIIKDEVVFGWIDEYVGLDDKAEVEKEKEKLKNTSSDINKRIEQLKAEVSKKPETVQESIFDLF